MRGLLKKDLKSIGQQSWVILLLVIFYAMMFLFGGKQNAGLFVGMIAMLGVLLPFTALSYDEKARWDRYALTMPISRAMLVWSKYLLSLLISVCSGLLALAICLASQAYPLKEALLLSWIMLGIALLFSAVIYPLYFKLGAEKARYALMVIFFLPTILIMLLSQAGFNLPDFDEMEMQRFLPFLPLVTMALFGASGLLSRRIYAKKEF
ncbi:MAG: ABC-2 transporter permease [Clostridia bacterium]|nr:ABC-2 transporter permease [Clostridia bacterium]